MHRLLELATEQDPEFGLFLRLAAVTGACRGALCALRYTDVDFDRRRVTIGRGIVHGPDGPVEKDTKTHLVQRVALDERTLVLLGEHRGRTVKRAATCGTVRRQVPDRQLLNRFRICFERVKSCPIECALVPVGAHQCALVPRSRTRGLPAE